MEFSPEMYTKLNDVCIATRDFQILVYRVNNFGDGIEFTIIRSRISANSNEPRLQNSFYSGKKFIFRMLFFFMLFFSKKLPLNVMKITNREILLPIMETYLLCVCELLSRRQALLKQMVFYYL